MNKCKHAFEQAARGFASIPADYEPHSIKDSIPNQQDWDEFNSRFCRELKKVGCMVGESELDDFWENNETFGNLLGYVYENCNCS